MTLDNEVGDVNGNNEVTIADINLVIIIRSHTKARCLKVFYKVSGFHSNFFEFEGMKSKNMFTLNRHICLFFSVKDYRARRKPR